MLHLLKKIVKKTVIYSGVAIGGSTAVILFNVGTSKWSDSHTWSSATKHYLTNKFMVCLGFISFRQLVKQSTNLRETQEKFLLEQIEKNKETQYGRDHNFNSIKNIQDFIHKHPLTRYSHYQPYVQKIMEGDLLTMTADVPLQLAVTSGTSGQSSLLPTTSEIFKRFFISGIAVLFQRLHETHPEWVTLQKSMKLFYTPRWRSTEHGLLIGPNSSNPDSAKRIYHLYTTPPAAYSILTEPEALYVHLLFGLLDSNLGIIESNFASTVYTGFKTLQQRWPELVKDIETGVLNQDLDIPEDVRKQIQAELKPNPQRAAALRKEFEAGFDDIAKRIWPNLNLVLATTTGTMSLYYKALAASTCSSIPAYSPIYGSSEGLLGVNLFPSQKHPNYCFVPSAQFFEFIPVSKSFEDQPDTLLLHQVVRGEEYELVITNPSGLYRYRLGDVIKVVDFFNEIPIMEFKYRQGQILNIHGEKLSEESLYVTLQQTASSWGVDVLDYTACENVLDQNDDEAEPHYILFVECEKPIERPEEIDLNLQENHPVYKSFRVKGSIGQLKVVQVKLGTFELLKKWMLENTDASSNQIKVPRVLKRKEAVRLMLENKLQE